MGASNAFQIISFVVHYLSALESPVLQFREVTELSLSHRSTLDKYRNEVEGFLPHTYMREDLYLSRFLRLTHFHLPEAVIALREAIKWRELNKMDNIDFEDFSDLKRDFPLYLDGVDREGRVIMEANFGKWPLRKAVMAGQLQRLQRYGVKAIEDVTKKVRELQEIQGKNVTQWVMLLNMEGFTKSEGACSLCLPYYSNFAKAYEKYYPFTVGQIIYVNTPGSFENVLKLVRPMMNSQTKKAMMVFGTDEKTWMPYLEQYFSKGQIGHWFGGHKQRMSSH